MMADFEDASRNAFLKVFPTATLRGCFFHYSQVSLKQVSGRGFKYHPTWVTFILVGWGNYPIFKLPDNFPF